MAEQIKIALQSEQPPAGEEYRFSYQDEGTESQFWLEIHFMPLRGEKDCIQHLLVILRNVTEARTAEISLQQNLDQQQFLNHLFQLIYQPHDLNAALEQVIGLIGAYTHASHVYLAVSSRDGRSAVITQEWFGKGVKPRSADLRAISYKRIPFLKMMEAHGVACLSERQGITPEAARLLKSWKIHSLAAIPIYDKNHLHGFIAYDDTELIREWSIEEQDLLRNISRAVSSAVVRQQLDEEERSQRLLAEVLRDISSVVNSTLSFEEMLDYLLINLQRVLPHQGANFTLLDEHNVLSVAKARGYPAHVMERLYNLHFPLSSWKTFQRVARSKDPILIPDTFRVKPWIKTDDASWFRSYIGAAVRARGKLLGILNVDSPIPGFFTPEHAGRVQAFANQAAVAIENARLYQEAHQRANQMTTLYDIGLMLAQGLEMNEVLTTLYNQCRSVLSNDAFYVAIYDESTHTVEHPLFYKGEQPITVPARDIRVQPGLSGMVIQRRKTLYVPDLLAPEAANYPAVRTAGRPTRSYVGVPLITRDQVVGVISMQSYQPGAYNRDEIRLLETIANQAAIAIENARIFNQMKQMAIIDPMTGAFTRWHFFNQGQNEIERSLRYGRPLTALMMDIDQFKTFNDTYGHNIGDQVIQEVARMCRQGLRASDLIGRYGGDEFCIILPETSLARALVTAERIRSLVESIEVNIPGTPSKVTLSIGVAELGQDSATLDQLLICADRALYAAKQAGRNCVKIYQHQVTPQL